MSLIFREETAADYRSVEEIIRNAFWNLYVPGCTEHYIAHNLRAHPDYIKSLSLVAVLDDEIIGNIMYSKTTVIDKNGVSHQLLTFGPVCIDPKYQRQGYGSALIRHTLDLATKAGYKAVVILGDPHDYIKYGFKNCKKFNLSLEGEIYPAGMLVLPLFDNALDQISGNVIFSEACFAFDELAFNEYDKTFPKLKREVKTSQELFDILSNAVIM